MGRRRSQVVGQPQNSSVQRDANTHAIALHNKACVDHCSMFAHKPLAELPTA